MIGAVQGASRFGPAYEYAFIVDTELLPAFRGIAALRGVDGLVNPRGFVVVDEYQRDPEFPNVYAVGVCVAIPPVAATPLPVGTPKTGYMIESMVTAVTHYLRAAIQGEPPAHRPTWNALCLADFGDNGVAFLALPRTPPRNTNRAARGKWAHLATIGFEKYFLRKMRRGDTEPCYEAAVLRLIGAARLKGGV